MNTTAHAYYAFVRDFGWSSVNSSTPALSSRILIQIKSIGLLLAFLLLLFLTFSLLVLL